MFVSFILFMVRTKWIMQYKKTWKTLPAKWCWKMCSFLFGASCAFWKKWYKHREKRVAILNIVERNCFRNNNFQQPQPGWPGPQRPPPPQQPHLPPSRDPNGDPSDPGRGGRKDRNRKNKPRNKDRRNKHDGPDGTPGSGPGGVTPLMPGSPGSDWNKNRAQNPPPSSPTDQYNNNDLQVCSLTHFMF